MLNQAQVLLKRSCTFGKLVNIHITGITLLCTGNNNICISCVFNGFKYICILGNFTSFLICRVESNILDPDLSQNCLKVANDATSGERFFFYLASIIFESLFLSLLQYGSQYKKRR